MQLTKSTHVRWPQIPSLYTKIFLSTTFLSLRSHLWCTFSKSFESFVHYYEKEKKFSFQFYAYEVKQDNNHCFYVIFFSCPPFVLCTC